MKNNNDNLLKLRHSAEHVLMHAIRNLKYKHYMAMGPAIEEGFYFDFELLEGELTEQDFEKIEVEMQHIKSQKLPITREEITIENARELFKDNPYKQEWLTEIEQKGEKATVYWTGKPQADNSFVDLCAGPHVNNTSEIGEFKLLNIAGAYWRGDEKNKMLTRIYGTSFPTKTELEEYLALLEEAKKRDHRILGKKLDLFHFSETVGQGLPLWTPKGTIIRDELENWAIETESKWGYVRIATPHIGKESLYLKSGHLPYYKDDMYPEMEIEGENYYLKGMNCPHHFELYNRKIHSYKELPLRYAEYGTVYRYEMSGSLFGLMRVRSIAQNDAHIFCSLQDAEKEFLDVIKLHEYYYNILGLSRNDYYIVIGLPSELKKDKYHGDKALWVKAETMMRNAIEKSGIESIDDIGGAAFYGPKIDFNIRSAIGREFSISTNQLDLFMPERFDMNFINENGGKERIAVIHRAPLGSHERFIGFLIEHFGGAFPVWLSPIQVKILTISENNIEYAKSITNVLSENSIRVEPDFSNETINNKIRKAQEEKVPYMIIAGKKEQETNTISVRDRNGKQTNNINIEDFTKSLKDRILSKSLDL